MSTKTGKKTEDSMLLDSSVTFHQLAMIRELFKKTWDIQGYVLI